MIFYDKLDLSTNQSENRIVNNSTNKIIYFEEGDYIYTFILNDGNKKLEYKIEILVE